MNIRNILNNAFTTAQKRILAAFVVAHTVLLLLAIFSTAVIAVNFGILLLALHLAYAWHTSKRHRIEICFLGFSAIGLFIFINISVWGLLLVGIGVVAMHVQSQTQGAKQ